MSIIPDLRVLFISHSPDIERGGGASISLYDLILDLKQRYNVIPSVLVFREGELSRKCREHNIEVLVMKYWWWTTAPFSVKFRDKVKRLIKRVPQKIRYCLRNIYSCFKMKRLLRGRKFDIIHTNTCVIDIGSKIAEFLNVPHVWHLREYGMAFAPSDFYVRREIHKAAAVITVSKAVYDYYVNEKRFSPADKTRIIYVGVKIPEAYEKKFNSGEKVNFCMTCMLLSNKNQLMAVRACARLKALTDDFTLHIIGAGGGSYLEELKREVKINNLEEHVKFLGMRYDIDEILKTMDVGLILSRREAFARVVLEYMLNYMPVIGTDTGGTPEIINDNETGFICRLDDTEQLAGLMHKFITDRELIKSMGLKARSRAENFSIKNDTDEVYKIYQEVVPSRM